MTTPNDGGPVYPTPITVTGSNNTVHAEATSGMSLRDHFAGLAMPTIYAEYWRGVNAKEYQCDPDWRDGIASDCYAMADAMLRARGE